MFCLLTVLTNNEYLASRTYCIGDIWTQRDKRLLPSWGLYDIQGGHRTQEILNHIASWNVVGTMEEHKVNVQVWYVYYIVQ